MNQSKHSLLSSKQVLELVPVSKTQLYRMINAGDFPRPVPVGSRRVAFLESEVKAWIESRLRLRKEGFGSENSRERAIRAVRRAAMTTLSDGQNVQQSSTKGSITQ